MKKRIIGVIVVISIIGYTITQYPEQRTYAYGSQQIRGIGSPLPYNLISEIGEDVEEESYADYLYRNCNENPAQYGYFLNKIIPYLCENCREEYWTIYGTSMQPTLASGTNIIMTTDFTNLTTGMIVRYNPQSDSKGSPLDMENTAKYGYNIIHRIVEVTNKGYIIKGDANDVCEFIPEVKSVLVSKIV